MQKVLFLLLSLIISSLSFGQSREGRYGQVDKKGFYSTMQVNLLMGKEVNKYTPYYYPSLETTSSSLWVLPATASHQMKLSLVPSLMVSGGYRLNTNWAIGAGTGFELFEKNLFPLFGEVRYMLDGQRITPFLALKGGYAIGNLKEKHYEELTLSWSSGTYNDVEFRNHGGLTLHPEVGVSIPLDGKCDLLLTAAVRHQRIKQKVTKVYEVNQHDQWEHKEKLNLLTIGVAFLFR